MAQRPQMTGQLTDAERSMLYRVVRERAPSLIFEVGTWRGGGSTWQLFRGIDDAQKGRLISCEPDKSCFAESQALYKDDKNVELWNVTSDVAIARLKALNLVPDFVFFDGAEDADISLRDFQAIENYVKSGCDFMMHDWIEPSIKARLVRPYLESLKTWKIYGTLMPPASVGLVHAIKL